MDKRTTLHCNETFLEMLFNCQKNHQKVAMLLDVNGLVRAEGIISHIHLDASVPFIRMKGGLKVALCTITALNGIFLPSYSEC